MVCVFVCPELVTCNYDGAHANGGVGAVRTGPGNYIDEVSISGA